MGEKSNLMKGPRKMVEKFKRIQKRLRNGFWVNAVHMKNTRNRLMLFDAVQKGWFFLNPSYGICKLLGEFRRMIWIFKIFVYSWPAWQMIKS